ncbi:aldo/keto reductase [Pseudoroseomonas cervicalis]|uniref:aldo/keto reductase n=1 Tax=Teichococcus cervicalis TaxID=204525 RepID=UPI002781FF65|nr:aldo/keto reductase [Pseudoroseomonas cervicalis]MDQ1081625.1 aryl-alcohol dehydrogenase-like predicted oxidoreductase [Pseudoroseomonas cervicalis]
MPATALPRRALGQTGLVVGACGLSLGAVPDRRQALRLLRQAREGGVTLFEAGTPEAEALLGEALRGEALHGEAAPPVLAARLPPPGPRAAGLRGAVEGALRRLRTDCLDLAQLPLPAPGEATEAALALLTTLIWEGKLRAFGVLEPQPSLLVEAHWRAEGRGLARPGSARALYAPLARGAERDLLPSCRRHGMGVLARGPARPMDAPQQAGLQRLAAAAGLTPAQLALAFTLAHPAVTAALVAPAGAAALEQALHAARLVPEPELLDGLDQLLPPGSDALPPEAPPAPTRRRPGEGRAAA